jgi:DNA-binding NarL/FixJ family response regulator
MSIRVAILDDNRHFRARLVERLEFFPELTIAFEAGSANEFLARLGRAADPVHVALLDIALPQSSGIDVATRLTEEYPAIGVLMFTVFEAEDTVLAAIQAGASGYLLKDAPVEAIVRAIREVHEGGVPLSRSVARRLLGVLAQAPAAPAPGGPAGPAAGQEDLSPREVELLERIVMGETEPVIAVHLDISPHTVRTHVKNIYRKLRVRTRAAAVRLAYQRGLIGRPQPPR